VLVGTRQREGGAEGGRDGGRDGGLEGGRTVRSVCVARIRSRECHPPKGDS